MSKNTEARKCVERWTFINGNGFTNQDIKNIVCKALEIKDRLEQADVNKAISDYLKDGALKPVEIVHFANGYNQALADIRGDKG